MFKENNQLALFTFEAELGEKQRALLDRSKEKWFYELIFKNINELDFKMLYSDKDSRPNVPVNILVSAMILKEYRGVSINELMESMMFDLRFKKALGLANIDDEPFSRATLFNFQNRILEHYQETGINLLENVFDNLTAKEIQQLSIKTDIQRTDSTQFFSNIRKFSRVQLLIEVLLRLERVLGDEDKEALLENLKPYLKLGSEKYVYALKSGTLPHELEKLGKVYHQVHSTVNKDTYQLTKEYVNFERVFREHFVVVEGGANPKPSSDLDSGMLQSPDDQEATYRKKNGKESKGFTINAFETANPDNPIQLLTDIATNPNNVDDSKILNDRLDGLKEKTPDLNELHEDGGYGSDENDKKCEDMGIAQVATAVRGRESEVEKIIEQTGQGPDTYTVECPVQKTASAPTKTRHKAQFGLGTCERCALKEKCPIFKANGKYYFTHEDYLLNKRSRNIINIPEERQKLRPNVEATMKEFKARAPGGKLKVRGEFKTGLFAFCIGIGINFGRIYRYIVEYELNISHISSIFSFFAKIWQLIVFQIPVSKKWVQIFKPQRKNFTHAILSN